MTSLAVNLGQPAAAAATEHLAAQQAQHLQPPTAQEVKLLPPVARTEGGHFGGGRGGGINPSWRGVGEHKLQLVGGLADQGVGDGFSRRRFWGGGGVQAPSMNPYARAICLWPSVPGDCCRVTADGMQQVVGVWGAGGRLADTAGTGSGGDDRAAAHCCTPSAPGSRDQPRRYPGTTLVYCRQPARRPARYACLLHPSKTS